MAFNKRDSDTGYASGSSFKKDSMYESTPTTSKKITRKRKSCANTTLLAECIPQNSIGHITKLPQQRNRLHSTPLSAILPVCNNRKHDMCTLNNTSIISDVSFDSKSIKSSSPFIRDNADYVLSSSLEKCSLLSDYEDFQSAKRCKQDDPNFYKSTSAPVSPQYITENQLHKKYYSLESTPIKTQRTKLGTPEKNKILYSKLVKIKPVTKPKSPKRLRNELQRHTKAKKRLLACRDFIYLFARIANYQDIIHKIFSYLRDSDLESVYQVSDLWKSALQNDCVAYNRYRLYMHKRTISKENIPQTCVQDYANAGSLNISSSISPPVSPSRQNFTKFLKVGENLLSFQKLTKCIQCISPAVLENNIAQCTKKTCHYIWCNKCLSGTELGYETFLCKCSNTDPTNKPKNSGLLDISNCIESASSSTFFIDNSSINSSAGGSSGYYTQSDFEKSSSSDVSNKFKSIVLKDFNKIVKTENKINNNLNYTSLHEVAMQCMKQNKNNNNNNYEPSSPPKVEQQIIGSQKSKKCLKRLKF